MTTIRTITNRYDGKCRLCGMTVNAGMGKAVKTGEASKWLTYCLPCHEQQQQQQEEGQGRQEGRQEEGRKNPSPQSCTAMLPPNRADRNIDPRTEILRHFSWSEFVSIAAHKSYTKNGTGSVHDRSGGGTGEDKWAGGSMQQALAMAQGTGYVDALPNAMALSDAVEDTIVTETMTPAFRTYYDTCGSLVDIARFLDGIPECMIEMTPIKVSKAGRAVRIAIPVCYSSSVPASVVLRRGAAVMALVDLLNKAQHPLEVWAAISITRAAQRLSYLIKIHEADSPLDMGQVMYALAHPTMLRRLGFSVEEHEPESIRTKFGLGGGYGSGYGSAPYGTRETDLPYEEGTTIIVPDLGYGDSKWMDDEFVIGWLKEQIGKVFS